MGNKSKQQQYSSLMTEIKKAMDDAANNREESFTLLKDVMHSIETDHINVDDMCRCGGQSSYRHNKYVMSTVYLFLGECYDFALDEESSNIELAKKYYTLSEQPPAKWRLARLYANKKLRYDGNINVIVTRLISESVHSLIGELDNQRYFTIRLEYLVSMYEDLNNLPPDEHQSTIQELYFEILRWIIDNKSNIRREHYDVIQQLLDFDVDCPTHADEMTKNDVYDLIN
jgi:hypothetical protein